jgi:predicted flap endonuclease-1-like 5' DNA nuclease
MTMSLLWYVLAGVLLGFAASTLWEWLYFRRKRLNWESERVQELEQELADEQALNEQMRRAREHENSGAVPEYASPSVFLESEAPAAKVAATEKEGTLEVTGDLTVAEDVVQEASSNPTSHETGTADKPVSSPTVLAERSPSAQQSSELAAQPASGAAIQVDGFEDDSTILGRLAAELAQAPDDEQDAPDVSGEDDEESHESSDLRNMYVARSSDHPDNLSKIKGIGDVYKYRLYGSGIYTWHQVAESDIETLRVATNAYPGSNVEEWPGQARELAEKNGREGAFYTGPVPDDLKQIIGIGPVSELTLYRAGICTYAQLAGSTVNELQQLFPIAIAGDEPDFDQWIRLAIELANRKK